MLIQGKARWAKIVGKPQPGYDKTQLEWSMDVYIDEAAKEAMTAEGVAGSIKNKGDGDYVSFKRRAIKRDGNPAQPIRVVDHHGNDWDNRLIGNGSTVNVKFAINETTYNGKMTLRPSIIAVQVWDLVEFEKGESFPTRESTPSESWSEVEEEVA